MANYISAIDIADKLKLDKNTIIKRFDNIGIQPLNLNHKLYYLKSDISYLSGAKVKRNIIRPAERFAVLEYFLSNRENSASDLEKVFFISQRRIDRIITDYLKNDYCVTVPSKMNKWESI